MTMISYQLENINKERAKKKAKTTQETFWS